MMLRVFLLATLILAACGGGGGAPAVTLISPQQAQAEIVAHAGDPDFVIVDVRTPNEYAAGHLENAVNVDFLDPAFEFLVSGLDRDSTYLVYCQLGGRSAAACDEMVDLGFRHLLDVEGGFEAWVDAGLPWVTP